MSIGLGIRGGGGTARGAFRRAYVGEDGLDDVEVCHLCALRMRKGKLTGSEGEERNTYAESRELEPDDECRLEGKVPGNVIENDTEGEGFKEVEGTEYDPVGEPLYVIMRAGTFDCLEGEVGRETPADEVGNGCGEDVEGVQKDDKQNTTDNSVGLGDLGTLLEVVEHRVLCELWELLGGEKDDNERCTCLLVKLIDVEIGLVGGLDKDGVLLDALSCGHGGSGGWGMRAVAARRRVDIH